MKEKYGEARLFAKRLLEQAYVMMKKCGNDF